MKRHTVLLTEKVRAQRNNDRSLLEDFLTGVDVTEIGVGELAHCCERRACDSGHA